MFRLLLAFTGTYLAPLMLAPWVTLLVVGQAGPGVAAGERAVVLAGLANLALFLSGSLACLWLSWPAKVHLGWKAGTAALHLALSLLTATAITLAAVFLLNR